MDVPLEPEAPEEWRKVAENDNYEVSDKSRVRRCVGGRGTRGVNYVLAAQLEHGYYVVAMPIGGVWRHMKVHRLVAKAFLPPPPSPLHVFVNHKNGIRTDNRVENLEWVTHAENNRHAQYELGNKRGKLTADDAHAIIVMFNGQMSTREISERLRISRSQVKRIIGGQAWVRVSDALPVARMAPEQRIPAPQGEELWAAYPPNPNIEVSTYGHVRDARTKKIRNLNANKDGRVRTHIHRTGEKQKQRLKLVHTMVMETHVGPCPAGHEVDHINGDMADNRLVNLRYLTHRANCRYRDGYAVR